MVIVFSQRILSRVLSTKLRSHFLDFEVPSSDLGRENIFVGFYFSLSSVPPYECCGNDFNCIIIASFQIFFYLPVMVRSMSLGVSLIASLNKLGIDIFFLKCREENFDVNWRQKSICCLVTTAVSSIRTNVSRAAVPIVYSVALKHFSVASTL
jgi:hypothetical protein